MTYLELSELLRCSPAEARGFAVKRSLDRKKSHDGLSRAKLDGQLSLAYLDSISRHQQGNPKTELDRAIGDLQDMYATMSTRRVPLPRQVG